MKATTTVKGLAVMLLAASVTVSAQGLGEGHGKGPGKDGGNAAGPGGQHQRPSPEQIAAHMMKTFDADNNAELSESELTKALDTLRQHRPPGPGGAAAAGTGTGAAAPGGTNETRPALPPADKVAAHVIEKFAADKKGLTEAELTKVIVERQARRAERGGGAAGAAPAPKS